VASRRAIKKALVRIYSSVVTHECFIGGLAVSAVVARDKEGKEPFLEISALFVLLESFRRLVNFPMAV
jgi:hypothetical protein